MMLLTEAVEDVEEGDQHHGYDVDGGSPFAHVKGSPGEVLAFSHDVRQERDQVGHRRQDDEGACQIEEGCGTSDRNGAETGRDDS